MAIQGVDARARGTSPLDATWRTGLLAGRGPFGLETAPLEQQATPKGDQNLVAAAGMPAAVPLEAPAAEAPPAAPEKPAEPEKGGLDALLDGLVKLLQKLVEVLAALLERLGGGKAPAPGQAPVAGGGPIGNAPAAPPPVAGGPQAPAAAPQAPVAAPQIAPVPDAPQFGAAPQAQPVTRVPQPPIDPAPQVPVAVEPVRVPPVAAAPVPDRGVPFGNPRPVARDPIFEPVAPKPGLEAPVLRNPILGAPKQPAWINDLLFDVQRKALAGPPAGGNAPEQPAVQPAPVEPMPLPVPPPAPRIQKLPDIVPGIFDKAPGFDAPVAPKRPFEPAPIVPDAPAPRARPAPWRPGNNRGGAYGGQKVLAMDTRSKPTGGGNQSVMV